MEQSKVLMSRRKVNSTAAALGVLLLTAGGAATAHAEEAKTYRWVEEPGDVVYSQLPPPPGVEAEVVPPPPPPAEPPEQAIQELPEQQQQLEDLREDREIAREKAVEEAKQAQSRSQGCAAAEQNVRVYRDSPPNRLIRD
ncbi:MAG: DUF4124 domain-containing protein, partial [Gammaproteobacteria bacterium]